MASALGKLVLFALVAAAAGCAGTTAPSTFAPYSQTDLITGAGAAAAFGNTVMVNYTGWLYDPSRTDGKGIPFDTSLGKTPFSFTLGGGQVIKGWEQGVPGMQVGGVRRLVIPPSLAYGATRSGAIPPYSTLVFDIELLEIQ